MKNNYSLDEILNAINDLHKIKKEKKIDQVKENKNMSQNLDIPKNTLKLIENFLSPGAIIAFDEINDENWPGETVALREWLNGRSMKIFHSKYKSAAGYIEFH